MKKVLAYLIALAVSLPLAAQEADTTVRVLPDSLALAAQLDSLWMPLDSLAAPTDSLAVPVDSSSVLLDQSILGLKMQGRYRPLNQPFNNSKALSANSYLYIIGSGYRQFADNYSNGPYLTLGWGKWISRWHGMKLNFGGGYFYDNYKPQRVVMADVRASYMFNLSGYVDGYKADRSIEWLPLAGLGFTMLTTEGKTTWGPSAHVGFDLNMRLFPGMDLVFEPLFELQNDSRRLSRMDVWRSYLFALHGGVGARFYIDKGLRGADPGKDWFFTLSGGVQKQNSELAGQIDFLKSLGGVGMSGFGRYYGDSFAFRIQTGFSWHYWKEIKPGDKDLYGNELEPGLFLSAYIPVRLDVMAEMLSLLLGDRIPEDYRLGVWAMGGPEAGLLFKQDPYYKNIIYPYAGASGALQVKYRLWKGVSIFLEPRLSWVPYSAHTFLRNDTQDDNYYDYVMSVSLGIETRLGNSYWKKSE